MCRPRKRRRRLRQRATYNVVAAKTVTFAYNADGAVDGARTSTTRTTPTSFGSSTLVAAAAYSYDHDSDLTGLTYTDGAGNLVAGYHYDYNTPGW